MARDLLPALRDDDPGDNAIVTGHLIDDLTGHPVAGALVRVSGSSADGVPLSAWAASDTDGNFTLGPGLARGRHYRVAVTHPDYAPATAADGLRVPGNLAHRVWAWTTLRLSRRWLL